jgi:hypothetical protein
LDVKKGENKIMKLKDYIDEVMKEEKIYQIEKSSTIRVDKKDSNNLVNNTSNIFGKLIDIEEYI